MARRRRSLRTLAVATNGVTVGASWSIMPDVLAEAHHGGASCNQFGASGFALVCGNGAALDMKNTVNPATHCDEHALGW